MKRILALLLVLMLAGIPCAAEEDLFVWDVPIVEFACEEFSVVLPDGMRLLDAEEMEGVSMAAMADTDAEEASIACIACSDEDERCVSISAVQWEDGAGEMALALAEAMMQIEGAEVSEAVYMPLERYDAAVYTILLEEMLYTQAVLADDALCLIVTCTGMDALELQEMLETVTLF